MPVYNAERYVAAAIQSILRQSFSDFELIVSDNASTDLTQEICREFARCDSRVRYVRQPTNVGVNKNHRLLIDLASPGAEFFRWAAADDLIHKNLIEIMVSVMDSEPSVVAVVPDIESIDADGKTIGHADRTLDLRKPDVVWRVKAVLMRRYQMVFTQGLMRLNALRRTSLRLDYFGWDFILLLELALRGPIAQPAGATLYRRRHDGEASGERTMTEIKRWVDPTLSARFLLPHWRWSYERIRAVLTAPVTTKNKIGAMRAVALHTWWSRRSLARDVALSAQMLFGKTDEVPF